MSLEVFERISVVSSRKPEVKSLRQIMTRQKGNLVASDMHQYLKNFESLLDVACKHGI